MGEVLGQLLPTAVGVALSPLPIVAVVLMLVTARGRINGPAFILGWWVGLAGIGAVVISAAGGASAAGDSGPATWVNWVKLIVGALLVAMASRQWRARPHDGVEPATPKWMGALDSFTPAKALGAGIVLTVANPKNLLLAIAAAVAVAGAGLSTGDETVVWIVFIVIASVGVAAPVVIFFAMGDRAGAVLDSLRNRLAHNNAVIMAVLLTVIGVKLIGDAISGFSA